jgi:hypothetical protein
MTDLIDLHAAHATQDSINHTPWIIQKNVTCERLGELPGHFTEEEVFHVLGFARKYELIAFNAGIQHAKSLSNTVLKDQITILQEELKSLSKDNEYLADVLEKFTNKEV